MDNQGQIYFGDSNNYLKYYKFADNDWRLEVAAKNIIFGASGKDVEEAFEEAYNKAQSASDTANAAKDSIDNLEIGGRNYVVKTDSFSLTKNGITVDYDGNVYHVYGTNIKTDADYGFAYFVDRTNVFEPGVVYTVSTTTPLPSGLYLGINTRNSIGKETKAASNAYFYGDGSKTSNTFTCIQDTNGELHCFFGVNAYCGTVDVTFKIKLEKGNRATDWTPAPEDVTATNYIHSDSTNGLVVNNNQTVGVGYDIQLKADGSNTGMNIRQDGEILASFLQNHVSLGKNSINSRVGMCGDKGGVSASFGYYVDSVTSNNAEMGSTLSFDFNETTFKNKVGQTTGFYEFTYTSAGGWKLFDPVNDTSYAVTLSQYGITMKTPTSSIKDHAGITINYVLDGSVKFYNADISNPVRKLELEMAENPSSSESDFANITIERQSGTYASGDGKEHSIITMMTLHEFANVATLQLFDDEISLNATHLYLTSSYGDGAIQLDGNTNINGELTIDTALSIADGGTGAKSLAAAQENLGIKAISERIDNLILGTGTSPVEVQDARLSSDGTRYPTLKSRLDAENSELKSDLLNNIHNYLCTYNKQGRTSGGVTYTYNGDGNYTVTGSQSGTSFINLTDPSVGLPNGIVAGETYFHNFNDPTGAVMLDAWCDGTRLFYSNKPGFFTVPENAQSLYFRLTTWNAENINVTVKIPIISTLRTLASDTICLPPDFYGESGSNSTLIKALTIAPKVKLLSGTYNIAVPLNIPESTTLEGAGVDSTIINFTASTGALITCQNGNECIKNLTISGGLTAKPSAYAGATIKRGIIVQGEVNKPTYLENIKVVGFSKDGILVQNRGYTSLCSVIANNLFMQYNGAGITFYEKGEYGVLTNSIAIDNYHGIIDSGGNNKISNCGFDRNTKGLYAGSVNNDTHSDVVGCSFNHCTSRGVECDGINSMLTFTACQFFGATDYDIHIYNAQAVSFVNCEFGLNAKLTFNKGSKGDNFYALNNCIFGNTPNVINVMAGTLLLVTNCYTQNGVEVTI